MGRPIRNVLLRPESHLLAQKSGLGGAASVSFRITASNVVVSYWGCQRNGTFLASSFHNRTFCFRPQTRCVAQALGLRSRRLKRC